MKKVKLLLFAAIAFVSTITIVNATTEVVNVTEDMVLDQDYDAQFVIDGKEVTIDLNGHTITTDGVGGAKRTMILQNGAKVTVKGQGIIRNTATGGKAGGVSVTESEFILESGKIETVEFGVIVYKDAIFTMNGGEIYTYDNCGAGGNGTAVPANQDYTININGGVINANISSSGYVSCGIYHPNKGTVNMTGGTINSSNGAGIVQRAGVLNVTGGTINTDEKTANIFGKVGDSRVVVPSSAIVIDKDANYPALATLKSTIGGDVVLNGKYDQIYILGNKDNISITGGVYTEEPAAEDVPEGHKAYKVLSGNNKDKYIIVNDAEVEYVVVDGMVPEESVSEEEVKLITNTIKNKFNLAGYYMIDLIQAAPTGEEIGSATEVEEEQDISLGIPPTLPPVKEGYTRKFVIVRIHNGEVTILDNVTVVGDEVKGKSNKFSTYALAYVDVEDKKEETKKEEEKNPSTYDSIITTAIVASISVAGLSGIALYMKKRFN